MEKGTGNRTAAAYDVVGRYKQDEVNGYGPGVVDHLIDAAQITGQEAVLDAMAGDGNLTERLGAYCKERRIPFPKTTVLEFSRLQAGFAEETLRPLGASVVWGDAVEMRNLASNQPLPDESFDRILIKSATHEIPCDKQPELYRSLFRILRPGGIFANLGFVFDDRSERDEVRELARIKDRLAGMDAAVRNRYFLLRDEFYGFLKAAGFVTVTAQESFLYQIRSQVVAEQYYRAPQRQDLDLENQAAQIRALTLRRNGRIRFEGTGSLLLFPGEITTARKPTLAQVNMTTFREYPMDLLRRVRVHADMLEEAAQYVRDGESILDLGCSIGLLTEHLPDRQIRYRGLDLSPEFVRVSQERYKARPELSFEVADILTHELGEAQYDVVTLLNTIHLPGIEAVPLLRKAYRALRPGGRIVVTGPRSQEAVTRTEPLILEQLRRDGAYAGNEDAIESLCRANRRLLTDRGYYCSVEGMEALLKKVGFSRTLAARPDLYHGWAYLVAAAK